MATVGVSGLISPWTPAVNVHAWPVFIAGSHGSVSGDVYTRLWRRVLKRSGRLSVSSPGETLWWLRYRPEYDADCMALVKSFIINQLLENIDLTVNIEIS